MSYLSIRNKIYDVINSLEESVGIPLFSNIYKFDASNPQGAPVAMIIMGNIDNEEATDQENKRTYSFIIRIEYDYKQIDQFDEEDVDEILMGISDKVIDAIDQNYTLSGEVDYCTPTPARLGWIDREGGQVRVATFNIQAFKLEEVSI